MEAAQNNNYNINNDARNDDIKKFVFASFSKGVAGSKIKAMSLQNKKTLMKIMKKSEESGFINLSGIDQKKLDKLNRSITSERSPSIMSRFVDNVYRKYSQEKFQNLFSLNDEFVKKIGDTNRINEEAIRNRKEGDPLTIKIIFKKEDIDDSEFVNDDIQRIFKGLEIVPIELSDSQVLYKEFLISIPGNIELESTPATYRGGFINDNSFHPNINSHFYFLSDKKGNDIMLDMDQYQGLSVYETPTENKINCIKRSLNKINSISEEGITSYSVENIKNFIEKNKEYILKNSNKLDTYYFTRFKDMKIPEDDKISPDKKKNLIELKEMAQKFSDELAAKKAEKKNPLPT